MNGSNTIGWGGLYIKKRKCQVLQICYFIALTLCVYQYVVLLQEAKCGFVLILMAVYWCTECLPLAITALLPVFFFPMMRMMTAEDVRVH